MTNYSTYAVCGLLLIASLIVLIRVLKVQDRGFLLFLSILLIVGEIAGLCSAYMIQRLFAIAIDLKTLLNTDPDYLVRLEHANAYMISIFFTSFNIAHWVFAMRYWSLALRLECLVGRVNVSTV